MDKRSGSVSNPSEVIPHKSDHRHIEPLNPAIVEKIVDNHRRELEIRAQEIELQKHQDKTAIEFGEKALTAKMNDRASQRNQERITQKNQYVFLCIIVLMILLFCGYALHLNKEQVVMELVKIIGTLVVGVFGGYQWGRVENKNSENKNYPGKSESEKM